MSGSKLQCKGETVTPLWTWASCLDQATTFSKTKPGQVRTPGWEQGALHCGALRPGPQGREGMGSVWGGGQSQDPRVGAGAPFMLQSETRTLGSAVSTSLWDQVRTPGWKKGPPLFWECRGQDPMMRSGPPSFGREVKNLAVCPQIPSSPKTLRRSSGVPGAPQCSRRQVLGDHRLKEGRGWGRTICNSWSASRDWSHALGWVWDRGAGQVGLGRCSAWNHLTCLEELSEKSSQALSGTCRVGSQPHPPNPEPVSSCVSQPWALYLLEDDWASWAAGTCCKAAPWWWVALPVVPLFIWDLWEGGSGVHKWRSTKTTRLSFGTLGFTLSYIFNPVPTAPLLTQRLFYQCQCHPCRMTPWVFPGSGSGRPNKNALFCKK